MKYIKETLETPIYGEYDVVIVGAGPAGCGAAIGCARSGLRTLLIEKFNCLGGAWTTGGVRSMAATVAAAAAGEGLGALPMAAVKC